MSGRLRQEFRELELLDDISKMRYNRTLPPDIEAPFRRAVIINFRKWKGKTYIPTPVHPALHWSDSAPFVTNSGEDLAWKVIKGKENRKEKGTSSLPIGHKNSNSFKQVVIKKQNQSKSIPDPLNEQSRIMAGLLTPRQSPVKNTQLNATEETVKEDVNIYTEAVMVPVQTPLTPPRTPERPQRHVAMHGMIWDSNDYSCAYDSCFTIMWHMWRENRILQDHEQLDNTALHTLFQGFSQHLIGQISLEKE